MSVPHYSAEADGPRTLGQRFGALLGAIRAWASTEVGGWIIVGVLALAVIVIGGIALLAPRLTPAPATDPASHTIQAGGLPQGPAGDLADFTLAPEAVQNISYDAARVWNAALPFSTDPIRPAASLVAPTTDIEAYSRALDCLTAAVYYEAASETPQGQAAVAQVVLNRARHPAYPRSVCGVVFQGSERTTGCQFSFTCDGAMARVPSAAGWARARGVASAALNGLVVAAVGTATHYHTDWVAPYWAPRLSKIVKIGTHIFYRWNGAWGLPAAFTGAYSGVEPVVPKMAGLSSIATVAPAEILDGTELASVVLDDATPRISPTVVVPEVLTSPAETDASVAPVAEAAPPPPVRAPVVPIMADPMVRPAAAPTRQRQRIAAPSGW